MILWFNVKQVDMSQTKKSDILWLILFVVVLVGIAYTLEFRRSKLLEKFDTTSAMVTSISPGGYKSQVKIYVTYKINGRKYESDCSGHLGWKKCFDNLTIGATIRIKYSLKDPEVVSILDCD
ncbi:MAG: hypothetical protein V4638_01210 [Bacteroidota bacterium]